jgi:toxin-antitoxin system PIN domain toxin
VIVVDGNLLIYACTPCAQHERARAWFDEVLSGSVRVGLPWISLLAFLRVVTNRGLYERPTSMADAYGQIEAWLEVPNVWIPAPSSRHQLYFRQTLAASGGLSRLVTDAHLAAIAIEHGLTVYSADSDFAKFSGLKWVNPLMPA